MVSEVLRSATWRLITTGHFRRTMTCHRATPKDSRDSEKGLLLGPRLLSKVPNVFHDNEKLAIDHVRMQH